MKAARFHILGLGGSLVLLLSLPAFGLEPGAANSPDTSEPARAYLQLQEQIRDAKAAIEQNRKASEESAAQNANAMAERLQALEKLMSEQRASDLQTAQNSRQAILVILPFVLLLSLAFLLAAYFQWRGMNHLGNISAVLLAGNGRNALRTETTLDTGASLDPVEPATSRLGAAMERLETRLQQLEQSPPLPLKNPPPANRQPEWRIAEGTPAAEMAAGQPLRQPLKTSLEKGQALLDQARFEEAVVFFDHMLAQDPENAEALVKKGQGLEHMHKLKEALACYDRAMALDSSIIIV
jgi:tetratricopeptide (TPR) repeat protein